MKLKVKAMRKNSKKQTESLRNQKIKISLVGYLQPWLPNVYALWRPSTETAAYFKCFNNSLFVVELMQYSGAGSGVSGVGVYQSVAVRDYVCCSFLVEIKIL